MWVTISIILAALIVGGFGVMLFVTYPISKRIYEEQLVKNSSEKWGRVCSAPENEEQVQMWNAGILWAEENKSNMREVSIESLSMKLYGEYYDFGSDKCAIILPGRCECLTYSYFFAKPYKEAGLNVLVIDTRCHGKSDGKYSTIGVYESYDLNAWMEYIKNQMGVKKFWLHGICIGSVSALLSASNSVENVEGVVLEGCFVDFRESFKQHMIEKKKPLFPVLDLVMFNIWKATGTNVMAKSPIKIVKKVNQPILLLFGEKDIFSIPEKSKKLYKACVSKEKKLVWFDKGGHSHLRINNTEKYDKAIKEFIKAYEE